ncbi:MAG: fumarate hydratase [Candidatus Desulfofervidus auxilii]|nr:fumarate hydratase [Candidatus Desulfofervidus auxilii]
MREIHIGEIKEAIKCLCQEACFSLNTDMIMALKKAQEEEISPLGKEIIGQLLENAKLAEDKKIPLCQDTGVVTIFLEIGQDVHLIGGDIREAIQEGVRQGYKEGFLRKSVCHPLTRKNTDDNTPAIIHFDIVPGKKVKIIIMPKGAGSENMSKATVFPPSVGVEGIENFVYETVKRAAVNTCSPLIVGVGIGGSLEKAALLAKKALLRPIGQKASDSELANLEKKWLEKINKFGFGPLGLGGRVTCLAVHIESYPCHIASLPVAINIQCHAHRLKEVII